MKSVWKIFLKGLNVVPVLHMSALLLLCFVQLTREQLLLLGAEAGLSTLVYFVYVGHYFNPVLKYCLFTRCVVIGLVLNHVLYELRPLLPDYAIYEALYTQFCFAFAGLMFVLIGGFRMRHKILTIITKLTKRKTNVLDENNPDKSIF